MSELLVRDVMHREVYSVPPTAEAGEVLGLILSVGITSMPVIDEAMQPLGLVSLRDLAGATRNQRVQDLMTKPPLTVSPTTPIRNAGRILGEREVHHLIVIDDNGALVGFLSALDVLRGLVDLPAAHPSAFPSLDLDGDLEWTVPLDLNDNNVNAAPQGPGMLALVCGDEVLWAEAHLAVRNRLLQIIADAAGLPPEVNDRLGDAKFRAARFSKDGSSLVHLLRGDT
jgi:hypothetical protein